MRNRHPRRGALDLLLMAMVCLLALTPACSDWWEQNTSSGGGESTLTNTGTGGGTLDDETLAKIKGLYAGEADVAIKGKVMGSDIGVDETVSLTISIADDGTVTVSDGDKLNASVVLEDTTFQVTGTLQTEYCKDVDITTAGSIADDKITGTLTGSGVCGVGSLGYPVSLSGDYVFEKTAPVASLRGKRSGLTFSQALARLEKP